MANNCRFLSRFALSGTTNKLRIDYSGEGSPVDLEFAEEDYFWSLDNETGAGKLDFAKELKDLLDDGTSPATWTVEIVGVNHTDASEALGAIRLSVSTGTFTYDWEDSTNTTIDPRIFGYGESPSNPSAAAAIVSPYGHRYGWLPNAPTYDNSAARREMVLSQSTTTGGYIDTVHWTTIDRVVWKVEFVLAARVSLDCAFDPARAAAAGMAQGDPNSPWERFYLDAVIDKRDIRHYRDISTYSTPATDFDGPYKLTVPQGMQHSSLGTAFRPMPGTADLYNVDVPCIEAL